MAAAKSNSETFFISKEMFGGLVLIAAAVLALVINNSAWSPWYSDLLATPVMVQAGALEINKPLLLWVNDGLMAIFFFLVGLEIKREVLEGELSTVDRAALPLIAAVGGMLLPSLIYLGVNFGTEGNWNGWAIPAATDIAFALGILALLGPAVPVALKVFLLGIAIIDDLGAILAIALFYTQDLSALSLTIGLGGFGVLVLLNRLGVKAVAPYVLIGLVVWVGVLKSGVHATLAGVLIALTIPMSDGKGNSPLKNMEHGLHAWVAYFILPVFAFFNSGVSFAGLSWEAVLAPLPLGIAFGLFLGKQLGVFGFSWFAVRLGFCRLPRGVSWAQVYGVACLTGIGFTMSIFIGTLAFETADQLNAVRLGVIMGSVVSTLLGLAVLKLVLKQRDTTAKEQQPQAATSLAE